MLPACTNSNTIFFKKQIENKIKIRSITTKYTLLLTTVCLYNVQLNNSDDHDVVIESRFKSNNGLNMPITGIFLIKHKVRSYCKNFFRFYRQVSLLVSSCVYLLILSEHFIVGVTL